MRYLLWANTVVFGVYEGNSEDEAIEHCVQDAGYASIEDMESRLECRCEILARKVESHWL